MGDIIFHKDILTLEYYPEEKILSAKFVVKIGELDFEKLKEYLKIFVDVINDYPIKGILWDFVNTHFTLTPEMYEDLFSLLTENFFRNNIVLFSYVMPKDYIFRTGLELFLSQLISSERNMLHRIGKDKLFPYVRRAYFEDKDKAFAWLKDRISKLNLEDI